MSKKDEFIKWCDEAKQSVPMTEDVELYFNALQVSAEKKETKEFTENGKMILQYMKDNKETYGNMFKAKAIGEGLGISSRTASGAMRKLVTGGYVDKVGESPAIYSVTDKGNEVDLSAE